MAGYAIVSWREWGENDTAGRGQSISSGAGCPTLIRAASRLAEKPRNESPPPFEHGQDYDRYTAGGILC